MVRHHLPTFRYQEDTGSHDLTAARCALDDTTNPGSRSLRMEGLSRDHTQNEHLPSSFEGRPQSDRARSVQCHWESRCSKKVERTHRCLRGRWLRFRKQRTGAAHGWRSISSSTGSWRTRLTGSEAGQGGEALLQLLLSAPSPPPASPCTPWRTSSLKYISFHSCIMVPQNSGNPI